MSNAPALPYVPDAELVQVVQAATRGRSTRPGPYQTANLYAPVASASGGIWRLSGHDWSVVLKLVRHSAEGNTMWLSGQDVAHWYYWRREVLAYTTGLLDVLTGELRAPTCYLAAEDEGGLVRLWLEDVKGLPGHEWPLERYRLASRHLGRAQGAFAVSGAPRAEPWLSRDWLRAYVQRRAAGFSPGDDGAAWAHPLLAGVLPDPPVAGLRRLWDDGQVFLATVDRLPRTLCHLDLHPANLFDANGQTVLIDWSFVGIGAIGEDAANLVPDSVLDFHVAPEQIDELWELVVEGYLEGLADGGWDGDSGLIRRGMAASIAAKYAWIPSAMVDSAREGRPLLNRRPLAQALSWWAPVVPFLVRMGAEARA